MLHVAEELSLGGRSLRRRRAEADADPGCSPTRTIRALGGPSPKTACVPNFQSRQPRHFFDALRSFGSVGRAGTKGSAESVSPPALPGPSTRAEVTRR